MIFQDLELCNSFEKGWYGENSMPLDPKVYENVTLIISKFDMIKNWRLVLRTNGSATILSDDDRALIDIAREHISYCITAQSGKNLTQRHLPFELATIGKILELWATC